MKFSKYLKIINKSISALAAKVIVLVYKGPIGVILKEINFYLTNLVKSATDSSAMAEVLVSRLNLEG